MRTTTMLTALLASLSLTTAEPAPGYNGYRLVWTDGFDGPAGTPPDASNWNMRTDIHVNNELQEYTTSSQNLQRSGVSTFQIVPQVDSAGKWTSGRLESWYSFTPEPGRLTVAEARIRFGDNPVDRKKGLWPAFWLLGDSCWRGTPWPSCGEVDVLETVNGQLTAYGTVHCGDSASGGPCNEPHGIGGTAGVPDQGWHTWRVVWDRTPGGWESETVTWYLDGRAFHQVSGARIRDPKTWASLAQKPLRFICNVAVGGTWVSFPPDLRLLMGFNFPSRHQSVC
jgi:beta-glucanase (GH16 family)